MIGGNLKAIFQVKTATTNDIGETILTWNKYYEINGWLDLSSGNSHYSHKTKTEDNSYVFISDYDSIVRDLDLTKCRVMINNKIYEIKSIDDPLELHDHLEITLSYLGLNNVK